MQKRRGWSSRSGTRLAAVVVGLLFISASATSAAQRRRKRKPQPKAAPAQPVPAPAPDPTPDPPKAPEPETAWSKGVSPEQRAQAQGLLDEGNKLFLDKNYPDALAKYQEAIKSWDHPAIRFNIVRAYINLDRPVEAYTNLESALRFGNAPLSDEIFAEAKNYEKLLLGQIADVEVTCKQKGVKVSLDGEAFLACPGSKKTRLRPGKHLVVGELVGFLTKTEEIVALPGKSETVKLKLMSMEDATITRRRWATWKPWTVAGAGFVLAGFGGLLQWKAVSDMDSYEENVKMDCPSGCYQPGTPGAEANPDATISGAVQDIKDRALLENKIAIGTMITGGAVLAAGIAMVILNRPQRVIDESLQNPKPTGPRMTTQVSADQVGIGFITDF